MADKKEVFKGKSIEDLYKEIYNNSRSTKTKINDLVKTMTGMVENTTDAIRMMPLIREYLDAGIKSDDHLIRLAQLIQRAETKASSGEIDLYGDLQSLLEESNQESAIKKLPKPD
jgi:predicted RecB family endonuclease